MCHCWNFLLLLTFLVNFYFSFKNLASPFLENLPSSQSRLSVPSFYSNVFHWKIVNLSQNSHRPSLCHIHLSNLKSSRNWSWKACWTFSELHSAQLQTPMNILPWELLRSQFSLCSPDKKIAQEERLISFPSDPFKWLLINFIDPVCSTFPRNMFF